MARRGKAQLGVVERFEPLTERVTAIIRQAILSGKFAPGTRLSVPELARQLGVSRTPAREALLILESEGLLATRSGLGLEVLIGDHDNLIEILELREAMEGLAARLAAERMSESERQKLSEL